MGVTNLIGAGPVAKFGRNAGCVTGDAIQDESNAMLIRTAEGAIELVSGSTADDSPSGTGALTVKVWGCDANWNPIEEIVVMNGQTAVDLVKDYMYIYRAKVLTTGTGNVNAGAITIRLDSAGATLAMITALYGQTQKAMMPIFSGCKYDVRKFRFDGVRVGTLTGEIALVEYAESGSTRVIHSVSFGNSNHYTVEWDKGHKMVYEKSLLYIMAMNMSGTGFITASFDGDMIRYADPD